MKKTLIFGLLAGLIMLAIGMLLGPVYQFLDPSLKSEYENANLFRPWTDPLMMLFFVHPFALGIILAWVWSKTKALFPGTSLLKKGLAFGLIYWVTSLPGMLISYSTFPLSLMMVASWSISGLMEGLCAGIFIAKTIK